MREAKLISFLLTQKPEEPINKEINDFMEDFEKKKQTKPDQTRDLSII